MLLLVMLANSQLHLYHYFERIISDYTSVKENNNNIFKRNGVHVVVKKLSVRNLKQRVKKKKNETINFKKRSAEKLFIGFSIFL